MINNSNPFVLKRHDTLPVFTVNVKTRGDLNEIIPFNMSAVTAVTFSMRDETGNMVVSSAPGQVVSNSGGTIQYSWANGDTDTAGKYTAEFQLTFSGGSVMSVPLLGFFNVFIGEDLNNI